MGGKEHDDQLNGSAKCKGERRMKKRLGGKSNEENARQRECAAEHFSNNRSSKLKTLLENP